MQFLQRLIENFIKEHVRRKRLYRVVSVLACIVVFVTTYAMILPAITLDRATAEEQPGIETEAAGDPAVSGDVNDDGEIDVIDAQLTLYHGVGLKVLTGNAALAADVDRSGEVDVMDAQLILYRGVGLIQEF